MMNFLETLLDRLRNFAKENGGVVTGLLLLPLFLFAAYFPAKDAFDSWRLSMAHQRQVEDAEAALAQGDSKPILAILRAELSDLERERDAIERYPYYEEKTFRRTGLETKTYDRTTKLPELYGKIATIKKRLSEIESENARNKEELSHALESKADEPSKSSGETSIDVVGAELEKDLISINEIRSNYLQAIRSYGSFDLAYRENPSQINTRNSRFGSSPKTLQKTQREIEWLHAPPRMMYRWKSLSEDGVGGFEFFDDGTLWRKEERYQVVTTNTAGKLLTWNTACKEKESDPTEWSEHAVEPVAFLECLGTRLSLTDPTDLSLPDSLERLTESDCQVLGRSEVNGVLCWHVGIQAYDKQAQNLSEIDKAKNLFVPKWRVEAWFDPEARFIPRKILVRQIQSQPVEQGKIRATAYEIMSYETLAGGNTERIFPKEWTRKTYESKPFSKDLLLNSTSFTLLNISDIDEKIDGRFEELKATNLPVIPKSEYGDWIRSNAQINE